MMSKETSLIVLKQKPIIEFSAMEARGLEVAEKIKAMNLDTIEASEANRSVMKKMRAELNKELDVFESQRKMIHGSITKPYKDFTDSYEKNIKVRFVDAATSLKEKIAIVESAMLEAKTSDIEAYFNTKKGGLDFISIEDAGLNIILSVTNKKLEAQINSFIDRVLDDVRAINSVDESIRIMSLYRSNLDASMSISTVLADIEREKEQEERRKKEEEAAKERLASRFEQEKLEEEQAAKERVERKKLDAGQLEQQRIQAAKNAKLNESREAELELARIEKAKERAAEELVVAEKEAARIEREKIETEKTEAAAKEIHTIKFSVSGTIAQLKEIKSFMEKLGVTYE